jgi:acetone carboxylase gamma subunit
MNVDIHFTDDQGNEFYIGIRNGDVSQVWKNKMDIGITDTSVYIEESKPEMFIDDEEWEREMGR